MRTRSWLPALVLALAFGGAAASAQQRPPPPTRAPTLADRLDLGPDQQVAWRDYQAELALERADAAHGRAQADLLNGMTTPQRLDWMLAQLPGREADARRSAAATRAFYQALKPDQRATFDRLTRVPAPPPAGGPVERTRTPGPSGSP